MYENIGFQGNIQFWLVTNLCLGTSLRHRLHGIACITMHRFVQIPHHASTPNLHQPRGRSKTNMCLLNFYRCWVDFHVKYMFFKWKSSRGIFKSYFLSVVHATGIFFLKMWISGFLGHAKFEKIHFPSYLVIFNPKTSKKTKNFWGLSEEFYVASSVGECVDVGIGSSGSA